MLDLLARCRCDDEAAGEKLPSGRRSGATRMIDDEAVGNAVYRLEVLPSTVELKTAVTPTAIARRKARTAHTYPKEMKTWLHAPRFLLLESKAATAQKAGILPAYQTCVQKAVASPLPMPLGVEKKSF